MMENKKHNFIAYALDQKTLQQQLKNPKWESSSSLGQRDVNSRISQDHSGIFLFQFGVVVYWNLDKMEGTMLMEDILRSMNTSLILPDIGDQFIVLENIQESPKVTWNQLIIDKLTVPRAEVIARVLAQSVALEKSENRVDELMQALTQKTEQLVKWQKIPFSPKGIESLVFDVMLFRKSLIAQLAILDRPEALWEDRTMDTLYGNIRDMFDIPERYEAIECKINTIQESLDLIINSIRDKRLVTLEIAIVICFLIELVILIIV